MLMRGRSLTVFICNIYAKNRVLFKMNKIFYNFHSYISIGLRARFFHTVNCSKYRWRNLKTVAQRYTKTTLLSHSPYFEYRRYDDSHSTKRQWKFSDDDEESGNEQRQSRNSRLYFLPAGIWATLKYYMGSSTQPLEDTEIKVKIQQAARHCREKNYDDALTVLHEALFKAERDKNDSAINYCLDMMANIYYYVGRYDEAEQLFATLIQRIVSAGNDAKGHAFATSPAVVELSLKLADIYALKGDDEKAESGFEFCIQTQKANLERAIDDYNKEKIKLGVAAQRHDMRINSDTSDPYALYGLVLETYGRYLGRKGRIEDSQMYINRALEMALEIYGPSHPHTLSVMNNFAVICIDHKQFEVAEKYLKQVVIRAPLLEDGGDLITGYYTNYAEVLWHLNRHEEALDYARRAAKLANDKSIGVDAKKRTEEYLKQLENEWKRVSKKKGK